MIWLSALFGQAILGWLIADFLAGAVHWAMDRYGHETMRWIGEGVIAPNRLHHRQPSAFLAGDLLDRNLTTWLFAGAIALAWLILLGPSIVWLAATAGGLLGAQAHAWAHRSLPRGGALRVLQEIGVLQHPTHHAVHHRAPFDRRYCPLSGSLNPVLDAVGFWARAEAALARCGIAREAA